MKVLLVATVQSHICQFHRPLIEMLHAHGCEVHVAARNNLAVKNGLRLDFADRVFDVPFERSPFSTQNMSAYRILKQIIDSGSYDVIHTNTPVGGIVGRLAARDARKKGCKVIYTAHGFHFFKGASRKNWMLFYPIEKFMCRYTDELIAINEEDFSLANTKFPVSVSHIHGIGANTKRYTMVTEEEKLALRNELNLSPEQKIVLCTGELNPNKNQITAIKAMKEVIKRIPEAVLLLAGNGETQSLLEQEIHTSGLDNKAKLLGYRTDLDRYVKSADLILSCSKREGLPINIIEGMLCGKPVVASINRGHRELVTQGKTGYLVEPTDTNGFADAIQNILANPELSHKMGQAGLEKAQFYTDIAVKQELEEIYRKRIGMV